MKRLHVSLGVRDLDAAVGFYSGMFAAEPTVKKGDNAIWMLDDPRVNFVVQTRDAKPGLSHFGIQVEDQAELNEVYGRLREAGGPIHDTGETVCCYAKSEKNWTADPDGTFWEAFLTLGDATTYGSDDGFDDMFAKTDKGDAVCCS